MDVFPGVVVGVDALTQSHRFFAPALVREELFVVGTGDLNTWAKRYSAIFVPTGELLAEAQTIQNTFPGLLDPKAEFEEADAYLCDRARQAPRGCSHHTRDAGLGKTQPKALPFHSRCLSRDRNSVF